MENAGCWEQGDVVSTIPHTPGGWLFLLILFLNNNNNDNHHNNNSLFFSSSFAPLAFPGLTLRAGEGVRVPLCRAAAAQGPAPGVPGGLPVRHPPPPAWGWELPGTVPR